MTKKILLTAFIAFGSISLSSARARIPACFPCESLQTVQELPEDSEVNETSVQKLNVSYIHEEYGVLWMALWNTEGRFVLSNEANTTYYEIDAETEKYLKENHKFDVKTADNPLSFWTKIGGKLVFILVVGGLMVGGSSFKRKRKEA
jgi:hypothetical protein